ncbi:hypothetical protein V6Z11_1Z041600 [Gossypium hirsutum]
MMKGLVVDESISNLTSTSGEVSASTNQEPLSKKKRNLPGNPDPETEVIALSPKTLLATNRFICEICNKGGHNLPWKLKQRTNKEDAYAVQSDWKSHSKICGTREYRCDCGNLFSRRDSFITHRAFCDALAEETARAITAANQPGSSVSHINMTNLESQPLLHGYALHAPSLNRDQDQRFNARVEAAGPDSGPPSINLSSSPFLLGHPLPHDENPSQNPSSTTLLPFQAPPASPHTSATALLQKAAQMGVTLSKPLQSPVVSMQRPYYYHHQAHMCELGSKFTHSLSSFGHKAGVTPGFLEQVANATKSSAVAGAGAAAPSSLLHDMMTSLSCTSELEGSSSFEQSFNGTWITKRNSNNFQENYIDRRNFSETKQSQSCRSDNHEGKGSGSSSNNIGGNDSFPHTDIPNLVGLNHHINSSSAYGQPNQHSETPWQG